MKNIPKVVAKRFPIYYRGLKRLRDNGVTRILSNQLGEYLHIESTTIRRDFSYLGELGKQGYGYDVNYVIEVLEKELNLEDEIKAALIGVGHLGTALIKFNSEAPNNISIQKAFDIRPEIIGTQIAGVQIYDINELENSIEDEEIAILAIPGNKAEEVMKRLRNTSVKGVINFSSRRCKSEKQFIVHNIDLTSEFQALSYFVKQKHN